MRLVPLILMMLATGCVPAIRMSGDAICDGTRTARADHAAALADEASDRVVVTGARLIDLLDAGCAR